MKPSICFALFVLLTATPSAAIDPCSVCQCQGTSISCSFVNLKSIEGFIFPNTTTSIDLSFNNIYFIPAGIFDVCASSLESLTLSYNELYELPTGLFGSNMTSLVSFDSSFNHLNTTLPSDLFSLTLNLIKVTLAANEIPEIPGGLFSRLINLTSLNLAENELLEIKADQFTGLGNVTELYFQRNQLKSIAPGAFVPLKNVSTLLFGSNEEVGPVSKAGFSSLVPHLKRLSTPYVVSCNRGGSPVTVLGQLVCEV
jgi:Leucine-rich repeat (LRR) protein